jgi:hypothetical protein
MFVTVLLIKKVDRGDRTLPHSAHAGVPEVEP